jgi:hypothetical protein
MFARVQLLPPDVVVAMAKAPLPVSPTATQSRFERHDTLLKYQTPDGGVWLTQIFPESVVTRIKGPPVLVSSPTAKHLDRDGHESPRTDELDGRLPLVHVEAAFVVTNAGGPNA